jgi:hypothetical protein
MNKKYLLGALGACLMSAAAAHAGTVVKAPDGGPFWHPLDAITGTYIYADSFVAPNSGKVTNIGLWLVNLTGDTSAQPISFEVLGGGLAGPDASQVLATTGALTLDVTGPLSLYSANTIGSDNLVAGQTYWVAGDERGFSGGGYLQVGAHTQNSGGIVDNGTFWYSNYQSGFFDGQNLTPEMAFTVNVANVPEPATWAMMTLGLFGAGALLRSRRRAALA